MDEKFEEFAKALRGKTAKQLRSLAESEGYDLPNFQDKDSLIHALYQVREKVSPPAAVHESEAVVPSSDAQPLPAGEPTLKLSVQAAYKHWRCGKLWGTKKVQIEVGEFTPEQWAVLAADKGLKVQ